MNNALYKKSFTLFLKRTNEKTVVKKFIQKNVSLSKNISFLDIGGGDGSLAREISKKVGSTIVVEPNKNFYKELKDKKIRVLKEKWENVQLNTCFDFILVAYVVTYFPKHKIDSLIKKMYKHLFPGGRIIILSVDARKGSWRKIHTYFYKLIGHIHDSSDDMLKKIIKSYKAISKTFKTKVVAKNSDEMLEILGFDFYRYPEDFSSFSRKLKEYFKKYTNQKGKVTLEMVHNAFIITKSNQIKK